MEKPPSANCGKQDAMRLRAKLLQMGSSGTAQLYGAIKDKHRAEMKKELQAIVAKLRSPVVRSRLSAVDDLVSVGRQTKGFLRQMLVEEEVDRKTVDKLIYEIDRYASARLPDPSKGEQGMADYEDSRVLAEELFAQITMSISDMFGPQEGCEAPDDAHLWAMIEIGLDRRNALAASLLGLGRAALDVLEEALGSREVLARRTGSQILCRLDSSITREIFFRKGVHPRHVFVRDIAADVIATASAEVAVDALLEIYGMAGAC